MICRCGDRPTLSRGGVLWEKGQPKADDFACESCGLPRCGCSSLEQRVERVANTTSGEVNYVCWACGWTFKGVDPDRGEPLTVTSDLLGREMNAAEFERQFLVWVRGLPLELRQASMARLCAHDDQFISTTMTRVGGGPARASDDFLVNVAGLCRRCDRSLVRRTMSLWSMVAPAMESARDAGLLAGRSEGRLALEAAEREVRNLRNNMAGSWSRVEEERAERVARRVSGRDEEPREGREIEL